MKDSTLKVLFDVSMVMNLGDLPDNSEIFVLVGDEAYKLIKKSRDVEYLPIVAR